MKIRKLLQYATALCLAVVMMLGLTKTTFAEDVVTIKVSGGSCEVGQKVKVTVSVSAPEDIGIVSFTLTYDAALLSYPEKNGAIKTVDESVSGKSSSYTFEFTAKKSGTASIKIADLEIYRLMAKNGKDEFDKENVSNGSVTIKEPYVASTNANLSKLTIGEGTLSPAFSADTLTYKTDVKGTVSSLTVSATPADKKAKAIVHNNKNLKEGENKVTIDVTAEDGKTKKTYTIIVTRAPAPTSTPKLTNTPTPTAKVEDTPTPTPNAEPTEPVKFAKDGEDRTLREEFEGDLPAGFLASSTTIDGKTVALAENDTGSIVLVQADDGNFYIYNKNAADDDAKYSIYRLLNVSAKPYVFLAKPEDTEIPDGFVAGTIDYDGSEITAYRTSADPNVALLYLRNPDGAEGWYIYDRSEETVQRYNENLIRTAPTPTAEPGQPSPEATPTPADNTDPDVTGTPDDPGDPTREIEISPTPASRDSSNPRSGLLWNFINKLSRREQIGAAIIAALLALFILFFILFCVERARFRRAVLAAGGKKKSDRRYDDDDDDDDDDGDGDDDYDGDGDDDYDDDLPYSDEDEMDMTFDPGLLTGDVKPAAKKPDKKAEKKAEKASAKEAAAAAKAAKSEKKTKTNKELQALLDEDCEDIFDEYD